VVVVVLLLREKRRIREERGRSLVVVVVLMMLSLEMRAVLGRRLLLEAASRFWSASTALHSCS
jgi:hypothetical protein